MQRLVGRQVFLPSNGVQQKNKEQSEKAGKMLTIFHPSGIEGLMQDTAAMTPEQATPEAYKMLMEKYDVVDLEQKT